MPDLEQLAQQYRGMGDGELARRVDNHEFLMQSWSQSLEYLEEMLANPEKAQQRVKDLRLWIKDAETKRDLGNAILLKRMMG